MSEALENEVRELRRQLKILTEEMVEEKRQEKFLRDLLDVRDKEIQQMGMELYELKRPK